MASESQLWGFEYGMNRLQTTLIALRTASLSLRTPWELIKRPLGSRMHVDLGSGFSAPRNPFMATRIIGSDHLPLDPAIHTFEYVQLDLTQRLPFEDNSIGSMSAYDVLEHIPRESSGKAHGFVGLMGEVFRVLEPGGVFYSVTPAAPSLAAFQDPTHVNFITFETLKYFDKETNFARNLGYWQAPGFEALHCFWALTQAPWSVERYLQPTRRIKDLVLVVLRLAGTLTGLYHPTHIVWMLRKPNLT